MLFLLARPRAGGASHDRLETLQALHEGIVHIRDIVDLILNRGPVLVIRFLLPNDAHELEVVATRPQLAVEYLGAQEFVSWLRVQEPLRSGKLLARPRVELPLTRLVVTEERSVAIEFLGHEPTYGGIFEFAQILLVTAHPLTVFFR